MHQRGEHRPQPPGVHGEPPHAAAHHAQLRRQAHPTPGRRASPSRRAIAPYPLPPARASPAHLADHPGLIQPQEQQPRRCQHMRHPAPRRLAPPAAKPAGDRPGRLLPPRSRAPSSSTARPVRARRSHREGTQPCPPSTPVPHAGHATGPPARQLPLDQIPIPGYRQHRRHHPCATTALPDAAKRSGRARVRLQDIPTQLTPI